MTRTPHRRADRRRRHRACAAGGHAQAIRAARRQADDRAQPSPRSPAHPAIDAVLIGDRRRPGAGAERGAGRRAARDRRRDAARIGVATGSRRLAGDGPDRVLIHDAARPFVPGAVIDRLLAALDDADGAVPALPVADTLARGDGDAGRHRAARRAVPRPDAAGVPLRRHRSLRIARWPDDETRPTMRRWFARAGGTRRAGRRRPDARQDSPIPPISRRPRRGMAAGMRVAQRDRLRRPPAGRRRGIVARRRADPARQGACRATATPMSRSMRSPTRCSARSRAGDIGTHFPPSDPQWRGADSAQFLDHAASAGRGARRHHRFHRPDADLRGAQDRAAPRRDARPDRRTVAARARSGQRQGDDHRAAWLHRPRRRHRRAGHRHRQNA